jgi:hypothetical protein
MQFGLLLMGLGIFSVEDRGKVLLHALLGNYLLGVLHSFSIHSRKKTHFQLAKIS